MSRIFSKLYLISLLFSSLTIFGCSSDDSAGGGATVPSGAVTITDANAIEVVTDAIDTGVALLDIVDLATAVDIDQAPTARDIIDLVIDKTKNISGTTVVSTPTGVAFSEPCTGGGTVSGDITSTATTDSGTVTFTDCVELGITLNGTVNFNSTTDVPDAGDFSDTLTGNISGSDGVETATLSGLSFNETGNDFDGDFSINTYTYSADFTGGDGFLAQLLTPITGIEAATCPDSGSILVTGSNNTQARGTIVPGTSVNDVKVEFNDGSGTFTEVTDSPVPCTTVF